MTVRATQAQGAELIERTAIPPDGLLYLANSAQMFYNLSISHAETIATISSQIFAWTHTRNTVFVTR